MSDLVGNPEDRFSRVEAQIHIHCRCTSENKGADQLRGYREADLRLCFRICNHKSKLSMISIDWSHKNVLAVHDFSKESKEVFKQICFQILFDTKYLLIHSA